MAKLPTPRTVTDELLAAVHTELVGLRADLASARGGEPAQAGEQVELVEPKKSSVRRPAKG
jgi:hypothetical protein